MSQLSCVDGSGISERFGCLIGSSLGNRQGQDPPSHDVIDSSPNLHGTLLRPLAGAFSAMGFSITFPPRRSNESKVFIPAAAAIILFVLAPTAFADVTPTNPLPTNDASAVTALTAIQAVAQSTVPSTVACAQYGSSTGAAANCNVSTPNTGFSGTLAASTLNNAYSVTMPKAGESTLTLSVTGLAGGAVVTAQKSYDGGATYQPMTYSPVANNPLSTINASGNYSFSVAGATNVTFTITTVGTGTVSLAGQVSSGSKEVAITNSPLVANLGYAISTSGSSLAPAIAPVTGKAIYVTHWDVVMAAAGTFQLEYATNSACTTGVVPLTGNYSFGANGGISVGGGLGQILPVIPTGDYLCINTGAAAAGEISYAIQ